MKGMVALGIDVVLGILLVLRSPLVTRGVYRVAFFVGLGAFGALLFLPASEEFTTLGQGLSASFGVVLFVLAGLAPYVLLIEAGIAGYWGFSSGLRYVSLALALLGAAAIALSFFLPGSSAGDRPGG